MNNYFPQISRFGLTSDLVAEIVNCLREDGRSGNEGILFLGGTISPNFQAEVNTVFIPVGDGVVKEPLHCRVSAEIMDAIGQMMHPPELILMMQVHTHNGYPWHSTTDNLYAFKSPGFLSVVIDRFGFDDPPDPYDWTYHECDESGLFRIWSATETQERIFISESREFRSLEVCR